MYLAELFRNIISTPCWNVARLLWIEWGQMTKHMFGISQTTNQLFNQPIHLSWRCLFLLRSLEDDPAANRFSMGNPMSATILTFLSVCRIIKTGVRWNMKWIGSLRETWAAENRWAMGTTIHYHIYWAFLDTGSLRVMAIVGICWSQELYLKMYK